MKTVNVQDEEYNYSFLDQIHIYLTINGTLLFLYCCTHCERLSLAPTRNKAEALGLNSHSSALDVLFNIPDKKKKRKSISKKESAANNSAMHRWTRNICFQVSFVHRPN